MGRPWMSCLFVAWGLWILCGSAAGAAEKTVAEEILDVLRANGQITAQQYEILVEKARAERTPLPAVAAQERERWTDRIHLSGDLRGRLENFWYHHDRTGSEDPDRTRLRIRARLALQAKINEYVDARVRLASGDSGSEGSRNQTLGGVAAWDGGAARDGEDFDPDPLWLDHTYLVFHAAKAGYPLGGRKLDLMFGKMPNPFRAPEGKDLIIWDGDLTFEGVALSYSVDPSETLGLSFNGGWFYARESSDGSDPHLAGAQLRADVKPSGAWKGGGMFSFYAWRSLDADFFSDNSRIAAGAGLAGGIDHTSMDIVDLRTWLTWTGSDRWPVKLYGNVSRNLDAASTSSLGTGAGKEDRAWSAGVELGSKNKIALIGGAYALVEANAVPDNFTHSDVFDGHTNRKGWVFYGTRQLLEHTELRLTFFKGKPLDRGITADLADSNRKRLQTDVFVTF